MKSHFVNKPLLRLQEKSNRKLFVIFAVIAVALIFISIGIYPYMVDVIKQLPPEIAGNMSAVSIAEYFDTAGFEYWLFVVSLFGAILAVNLTTGEFRNGSYELIYTLNISRAEVVRTKVVRLILNLFYINLICAIASFAGLWIFGGIQSFNILNFLLYALLTTLVSMQISIIVFSFGLFSKNKRNLGVMILLVLLLYLINSLSAGFPDNKGEVLSYFTPFSTIGSSWVLVKGFKGLFTNGIVFLAWSVVSVVLLFFSWKKFKNDDLC